MADEQSSKAPEPIPGFDEDVLAELEGSLEGLGDQADAQPGDKVELDKADLPLDDIMGPGEPEPPTELDVDLPEVEEEPLPPTDEEGLDLTDEQEGLSKKAKLLIALAGVLLVAALATGIGVWYSMREVTKIEKQPQAEEQAPEVDPREALRFTLKPFIVPLLKSSEGRILNVGVTLEAVDKEAKASLGEQTITLRDTIYRLLRDRPAGELKNARAARLLQSQIKAEVNHALGKQMVNRVFFTEFVITG